jgi:ATP-binding cassette subfamily F protein 3
MILSCSNITKSFGDKHILKQVSFHLEDHEKAAIVGINGAGKTTLLKIMIGELAADEGVVALSKGTTIGYLAQHQDLDSENTIYEALLEVKRPVIEMEERIRSLELKMHSASGDALEAMLAEYSRLNHAFELADGYAYKSEVTGVLKGLGFSEDEFTKPINTFRRPENTRIPWQAPAYQAGRTAA